MPTVQPYGGRKVATAALPGVRKREGATALSEGAGVEQAKGAAALSGAKAAAQKYDAIANVGEGVARIGVQQFAELEAQERQRADDVALMAAKNKIARWETDRLYDPEKGALAQKGKNALGLPETLDSEFTKLTGEIETNLNPRQRELFARVKGDSSVNLHATIQRHVFGQMQAYEGEELQARIQTGQDLAVANALDPRRVGVELQGIVDDFTKSAPRQGLGPEQIKAGVAKIQSTTHVAVIERLLDNKETGKAQAYYDEAKEQIAGNARGNLEKALAVGNTRAEAQRLSDTIIAKGGSLTDQIQAVKDTGASGDARDEAIRYIKENHAVLKAEEAQAASALRDDVYTKLHQSGGTYRLTPHEEVALGDGVASFDAYKKNLLTGDPTKTDQPTFYAFMEQASTEPEKFLAQNLLDYRHKLSDGDFQQLTELKSRIRGGKVPKELDDYRQEAGIISDALSQAGIEPTPADKDTEGKARVARLHSLVAAEVRRVQGETGKKISNDDLEAIAHRMLAKQITEKGWFWSSSKSLGKATIADVPKAERALIEDALKYHHQPVSDDTILSTWMQRQIRAKDAP